jgi:hypothetical protein
MMSFGRQKLRGLRSVLLAVQLVAVSASAMPETRSLRGVVTSMDGKPVKGAAVKLKNTVTLQIRSFITQTDGSYRFYRLNPDIAYEVWATYQGVSSDVKILSKFNPENTATIDLRVEK